MKQPTSEHNWIPALASAAERCGTRFPPADSVAMNIATWTSPSTSRRLTLRRALRPKGAPGYGATTWAFWENQALPEPALLLNEVRDPSQQLADSYFRLFHEWLVEGVAKETFRASHSHEFPLVPPESVPDWKLFGSKQEFGIEIGDGLWRMWLGRRVVTCHYGADRATSDWLPMDLLVRLCDWIRASWIPLAFGTDVRPELIREGSASASHAVEAAQYWSRSRPDQWKEVLEWCRRHAFRSAAAELPNVYLERQADEFILSWNSEPGGGMSFPIDSGAHVCPARFAVPLLRDLCDHILQESSSVRQGASEDSVLGVREFAVDVLQEFHPAEQISIDWLQSAGFGKRELSEALLTGSSHHPVLGLLRSSRNSSITLDEIAELIQDLRPANDSSYLKLRNLGDRLLTSIDPREPWMSGYRLAAEIRSRLHLVEGEIVELPPILSALDIDFLERPFSDQSIRGACVGSPAYRPTIVLNSNCELASGRSGQRTTVAHELCHLLFDRSRMRGLARFEGPIADSDRLVEMRANAFAMEFLAPMTNLIRSGGEVTPDEELSPVSERFQVSVIALQWHAQNLRRLRRV